MKIKRLALSYLLLSSALALADPKEDAKKHVDAATAAHAQGKFDVALNELTLAYSLDPQPQLLYAIGQVHVKLGHCKEAIDFYERFLASKPAQDAADVAQQAIDACKKQPAEAAPPPPPPPQPPPPPPPQTAQQPLPPPAARGDAFYHDVIGDALVGAGVVALVAGLFEYKAALDDLDSADQQTTYDAHKSFVDDASSKRAIAVACSLGGVALVTVGIYRFATHHDEHGVAIVPTRSGGLVTWGGRF